MRVLGNELCFSQGPNLPTLWYFEYNVAKVEAACATPQGSTNLVLSLPALIGACLMHFIGIKEKHKVYQRFFSFLFVFSYLERPGLIWL